MVNNQVWPMPLLPDSPEITGDKNTATTQLLCPLNINFVFGPLPLRQTVGIDCRTVGSFQAVFQGQSALSGDGVSLQACLS